MLLKHHLVLNEEMGDIVLEIDSLADSVDTDHLSSAFDGKTHQLRRCTQDGITQVGLDLPAIDSLGEEGLRLGKISQDGPSHCDLLIEERILMVDVKTVLEGRVLVSRHLDEVAHEGILRDREGLRDDDVVSLGEERKCELYEIQTPSLVYLINTEQIDDDGIGRRIGDLRQLSFLQVRDKLLVRSVIELSGIGGKPLVLLGLLSSLYLLGLGLQTLALHIAQTGKADIELLHSLDSLIEIFERDQSLRDIDELRVCFFLNCQVLLLLETFLHADHTFFIFDISKCLKDTAHIIADLRTHRHSRLGQSFSKHVQIH